MTKKVTLLDGSGQPLPSEDDGVGDNLPPGVQALIEVRLNSALDNLRQSNCAELKSLADDSARWWRRLALASSVITVLTLFVAPAQVFNWIGNQIDERLTEPMVRDRANRVIQDGMRDFVSEKLRPLGQQADQLKVAIDEMTATMTTRQTTIEDQQKRLSSQFDVLAARAEESLSRMERTNEFMTLVTKAQNDDRSAFDQLLLHRRTKGPFQDIAVRVVQELALELTQVIRTDPPVNWKDVGINPQSATLDELSIGFRKVVRAFQPAYLRDVWHQDRFTRAERLQFLSDTIGSTGSLRTLQAACVLMDTEAKIHQNFLRAEAYQQWWDQNRSANAVKESPK